MDVILRDSGPVYTGPENTVTPTLILAPGEDGAKRAPIALRPMEVKRDKGELLLAILAELMLRNLGKGDVTSVILRGNVVPRTYTFEEFFFPE